MRLSNATLGSLPTYIGRPSYDPAALQGSIVHLGLGAFHRAHQAVYTETVLRDGDLRWGITGASLRSPATRDALMPQDGLYTLAVRGNGEALSVIGALKRILVAPDNPQALLAAMADPATRIVSLTVTEKAYGHHPATGDLDTANPAIAHDLVHPSDPRSPLGLLAAALRQRRLAGVAPFTVLCCDNLPANGRALHRLLTQFAAAQDEDLAAFVAGEVTCPDTVVDRIVPATSDADRLAVSSSLAMRDAWPVITEPFSQWVIEDRFPLGRPAWEIGGATLVSDVAPFEAMKLRMLNAAHSALAYLGQLSGIETVADAMALPELAAFAAQVMDEAAATLPARLDTADYKRSCLARFGNPALRHRTAQVAMDGTQKLPPRILSTLAARLARGLSIETQAMAVAAWMRVVTGLNDAGRPIAISDPMASTLARLVASGGPSPAGIAQALLGLRPMFGALGDDPRVHGPVIAAFTRLYREGALRAISEPAWIGRRRGPC